MAIKATKVRFTKAKGGSAGITGASRGRVRAGKNNAAQKAGYAKAVAAGYFDDAGGKVWRSSGSIPD